MKMIVRYKVWWKGRLHRHCSIDLVRRPQPLPSPPLPLPPPLQPSLYSFLHTFFFIPFNFINMHSWLIYHAKKNAFKSYTSIKHWAYHLAQKYRLSKVKLLSIVVISSTKLYFSLQILDIVFYIKFCRPSSSNFLAIFFFKHFHTYVYLFWYKIKTV